MKRIFTICLLLLTIDTYSQPAINIAAELVKEPRSEAEPKYSKYFEEADNEVEMAYTGLFVFYKSFISSQDGSNCSFTPSCSEYAVHAIEAHGLIKGPIMFLDRYTRCNSLSPSFYKKNLSKGKLIDEVGDF